MVLECDDGGRLQDMPLGNLQHVIAHGRMGLNNVELFWGQLAGLVQYGVWNAHLTHIVEGRGQAQDFCFRRAKTAFQSQ